MSICRFLCKKDSFRRSHLRAEYNKYLNTYAICSFEMCHPTRWIFVDATDSIKHFHATLKVYIRLHDSFSLLRLLDKVEAKVMWAPIFWFWWVCILELLCMSHNTYLTEATMISLEWKDLILSEAKESSSASPGVHCYILKSPREGRI